MNSLLHRITLVVLEVQYSTVHYSATFWVGAWKRPGRWEVIRLLGWTRCNDQYIDMWCVEVVRY